MNQAPMDEEDIVILHPNDGLIRELGGDSDKIAAPSKAPPKQPAKEQPISSHVPSTSRLGHSAYKANKYRGTSSVSKSLKKTSRRTHLPFDTYRHSLNSTQTQPISSADPITRPGKDIKRKVFPSSTSVVQSSLPKRSPLSIRLLFHRRKIQQLRDYYRLKAASIQIGQTSVSTILNASSNAIMIISSDNPESMKCTLQDLLQFLFHIPHREDTLIQVDLRILLNKFNASQIIGRQGKTIKAIREESLAEIKIHNEYAPVSQERVFWAQGGLAYVVSAFSQVIRIIQTAPTSVQTTPSKLYTPKLALDYFFSYCGGFFTTPPPATQSSGTLLSRPNLPFSSSHLEQTYSTPVLHSQARKRNIIYQEETSDVSEKQSQDSWIPDSEPSYQDATQKEIFLEGDSDTDDEVEYLKRVALSSTSMADKMVSPKLNFYFISESHLAENHVPEFPAFFKSRCPQNWVCHPVESRSGGRYWSLEKKIIYRMSSKSPYDIVIAVIGSNDIRSMMKKRQEPWEVIERILEKTTQSSPLLILTSPIPSPCYGEVQDKEDEDFRKWCQEDPCTHEKGLGAILQVYNRLVLKLTEGKENVAVIDLSSHFSTPSRMADRKLYEIDGIHLNESGNVILVDRLLHGLLEVVENYPTFASGRKLWGDCV